MRRFLLIEWRKSGSGSDEKLFLHIVPSISRPFGPPSFKRGLTGGGLRPHFLIARSAFLLSLLREEGGAKRRMMETL